MVGDAQAIALDMGIKAIQKLEKIEEIIETKDRYNFPDDVYSYEIREVLGKERK